MLSGEKVVIHRVEESWRERENMFLECHEEKNTKGSKHEIYMVTLMSGAFITPPTKQGDSWKELGCS